MKARTSRLFTVRYYVVYVFALASLSLVLRNHDRLWAWVPVVVLASSRGSWLRPCKGKHRGYHAPRQ